MKSSADFLLETAKYELDIVNKYLVPAGIQESHTADLTAEDLSRKKAEDQEIQEISKALTKNSTPKVAAAARVAHEANRARRDINIAEASHKQLLLGVYRTMYQRKLKLEKYVKENTNG